MRRLQEERDRKLREQREAGKAEIRKLKEARGVEGTREGSPNEACPEGRGANWLPSRWTVSRAHPKEMPHSADRRN